MRTQQEGSRDTEGLYEQDDRRRSEEITGGIIKNVIVGRPMGRSTVFFKEGKKREEIRTMEKRRDSWIQNEKIKPEIREQRKRK